MPDYRIIDTVSGLEQVAQALEREKTIAVDLESDSMYHYKEKVCLIQMATKSNSLVIDPLRIKNLSSLKPLFSRDDIKKYSTAPTMISVLFSGISTLR